MQLIVHCPSPPLRAFGRIGTAYSKREDYNNAIKFFQKSLTEHRTPDILNKLKEAERQQAEADRKAYLNPELAEEARNAGNIKFKAGDFAGSVADYTEAIKRNPEDPRNYTNRASAYTKLMAISEAMKDAESAIKVDPTFAKAYCRKANVKFASKPPFLSLSLDPVPCALPLTLYLTSQ